MRHLYHAESLVKDIKIKACKDYGAGGRKSFRGRNPLGKLKMMSKMLLQLCAVAEIYFMHLTNTQSLTKYASIEKVPGCANNSTLTFKQDQPTE